MQTVWIVTSEFSGPGFKNPGDAAESVIEGVFSTEIAARKFADRVRRHYEQDFGHVPLGPGREDEWEFDMRVVELVVDQPQPES